MERTDYIEITISTFTYPRDSIASKTGILARRNTGWGWIKNGSCDTLEMWTTIQENDSRNYSLVIYFRACEPFQHRTSIHSRYRSKNARFAMKISRLDTKAL